ncbi:hypothetical protein ACFYMW_09390 [Streptomyces sp. NPDC006692]|uniref:hypothetical protein n=1 Tax=unclassified Streptomyces TaxID=2593676 RepID=UPI0036A158FD
MTNVRTLEGALVSDVLVSGQGGKVGWKAQYSPISESAVYRRTAQAREQTITPLWVTPDVTSALIDRAPWVRVDDMPSREITSRLSMLIRGGVRHLQIWKCTPVSERPCPQNGQACDQWHCGWFLPGLCIPQERATSLDELIVTSADGEHQIVRTRAPDNARRISHLWALASDVERWHELIGSPSPAPDEPGDEEPLTFTNEDIDPVCRYGDERPHRDRRRPLRDMSAATGVHTLTTEPELTYRTPSRPVQLRLSARARQVVAAELGCRVWEVGPCMLCAEPIHRYGRGGYLACRNCRAGTTGR